MNTAKQAAVVLDEAEAKLRALVGQAAGGSEYDLAARLAAVAKGVAALTLQLLDRDAEQTLAMNAPVPAVETRGAASSDRAVKSDDDRKAMKPVPKKGRRPKSGEYPKFFRDGDQLVKVAWSKKDRREYQHKAPYRVTELLASAIAKRAGNGRLFTSDDVFPLQDAQSGGEVPSYQAYSALAWFRAADLVQVHGRKGYTCKNQARLTENMATLWTGLTEMPQ